MAPDGRQERLVRVDRRGVLLDVRGPEAEGRGVGPVQQPERGVQDAVIVTVTFGSATEGKRMFGCQMSWVDIKGCSDVRCRG